MVEELGPDAVLATSFTVTAARSLIAMGLPLPSHQVGTLHSMAYRAVGNFLDVATEPKVLRDWNSRVGHEWELTPDARRGKPDTADVGAAGGGSGGDELLTAYDLARSQFVPLSDMPHAVREFAKAWDAWKRETEAVDFTDMILIALEHALDGEAAPGAPKVLIADEAQDMTPLEIALVLAWGRRAQRTIFALDDDQAIMNWRGGNCEPLVSLGTGIDGGPQLDVDVIDTFLEQSWRIPASVHMVAQTWIEGCGFRQPKNYRSRDVDGRIYAVGATLADMVTAEQIAKNAHAGREVMVLAACEYMLRPLIANLRKIGVPYSNIYRPAEGRWNPLRGSGGKTAAQRLFAYLASDDRALGGFERGPRATPGGRARLWTGDDVRAWIELVAADAGLARGAKSRIAENLPAGPLDIAQVEVLFSDEMSDADYTAALEPSLAWFMGAVVPSARSKLVYPEAIVRAFGPAALVDKPLVTIGTIHSVKGGQAGHPATEIEPARQGVVYLSPSLSPAGLAEWQRGGRSRDNVIRQFYVGLTRTYTTCVILAPTDRCAIPRETLIPQGMQVR